MLATVCSSNWERVEVSNSSPYPAHACAPLTPHAHATVSRPPLPPLPSAPHVDAFHGVPFATCTHLCALSLAAFVLSQGSDFCLFYSVRDRCPHVADTGNYTERCSAALKTWVLSDQIFLQCCPHLSFAFSVLGSTKQHDRSFHLCNDFNFGVSCGFKMEKGRCEEPTCTEAAVCGAQTARSLRVTELITRLQASLRGWLQRRSYARQQAAAVMIQVPLPRPGWRHWCCAAQLHSRQRGLAKGRREGGGGCLPCTHLGAGRGGITFYPPSLQNFRVSGARDPESILRHRIPSLRFTRGIRDAFVLVLWNDQM